MTDHEATRGPRRRMSRRTFVTALGAASAAPIAAKMVWDHAEGFRSARVFVAKAEGYGESLRPVILSGLRAIGIDRDAVRGKVVLLKPNLVEPAEESQCVVTHPAVVQAAAESFLSMGARAILVGDGPGHCRDAYLVAETAGLRPVLRDLKARFVDLNHDRVVSRPNALGWTGLSRLYLPATLLEADIVVSIAKLKTHHWAGVTLSMKNLFGVLPGIYYGWPKNILHEAGIVQSILDINATVKPDLAIIDGIVGMEGDGPIMGTPNRAGLLVIGDNPTAVDATATRLIGAEPEQIEYLAAAAGRLGPIGESRIEQRGESIARVAARFRFTGRVPSGMGRGSVDS